MVLERRPLAVFGAALVLFLLALLVAPLGPVGLLSFLLPVPVAVVHHRQGAAAGVLAAAVASAVLAVVLGPFLGVGVFVAATTGGLVMGQGLLGGQTPGATIVTAAALLCTAIVVFLLVDGLVASHGSDPLYAAREVVHFTTASLRASRRQLAAAYEANGLSPSQAKAQAAALWNTVQTDVLPVLPALAVLAVAGNVSLAYALTRVLLRSVHLPPVQPFAQWQSPYWLPPVFLVATVLVMWLGQGRGGLVPVVAQNVYLLSAVPLAVHGLAVLYHLLQRLRAGRVLSVFALVVVVVLPLSLPLLAWLSVADMLTDLRRLHPRERR
jgi:uncharacterized protein YybS (DUF2232 family)